MEGADPVKREVKLELGSEEETETGLSDSEEDEEEEAKPRLGRPSACEYAPCRLRVWH